MSLLDIFKQSSHKSYVQFCKYCYKVDSKKVKYEMKMINENVIKVLDDNIHGKSELDNKMCSCVSMVGLFYLQSLENCVPGNNLEQLHQPEINSIASANIFVYYLKIYLYNKELLFRNIPKKKIYFTHRNTHYFKILKNMYVILSFNRSFWH